MFISVSTHIFVYHEFTEEFIDIIEDSGAKAIEIFAVNPHFSYRDKKYVDTIVNSCRRKNITIHSVHFPLYYHIDDIKKNRWLSLSSEDEELRFSSIRETIAASHILDSDTGGVLVVHPSIPGGDLGGKRTFLFIDSMQRLLEELPDNVKIAIENTTSPSGTALKTVELARSFPGDRVGVCIDIGHANVVESPAYALVTTDSRLINIHGSDNLGESDDHLPPGDGEVNWGQIIHTLKELDYRGPLTLEIRDPLKGVRLDPILLKDMISKSVHYLQSLIEGE
jgi:sugar phosphate isomerase/epimerase